VRGDRDEGPAGPGRVAMFTALGRDGGPSTAASLARIRATLRTALNAALRHGLIAVNPACRVELPPARRPKAVVWTSTRIEEWRRTGIRPPVAVWTAGQTGQFLHAIRAHRLYAAYHLIALRGLRRGEAAGLRWCDIDLDGAVATISQQLQQYDGHMVVGPPKTPRSERTVAWIARPSPRCADTGSSRPWNGSRVVRPIRTVASSSPGYAVTRWHRTG
jgi:integrase